MGRPKPIPLKAFRTLRQRCARVGWDVVALALALAGIASGSSAETINGRAVVIVDGDTLALDSLPVRLRLWGIDTPEPGDPGHREATARLAALAQGRSLSCDLLDRDRYGRAVAVCRLPDGRDVGQVLVSEGLACDYQRYSRGRYRAEMERARAARAGTWALAPRPAAWDRRCALAAPGGP